MQTSISTDRLSIDPITSVDNNFVLKLVNSKGWIEFIGDKNIRSPEDSSSYIQRIIDNPKIDYWIVRIKGNNAPIGIITLIKRDYLAHYDIGFAFLPAYANNGYAHEATKAVLYNVTHSPDHSHILGITNPNNISAIKLLKKLGLKFENEIEVEDTKMQVYGVSTVKLRRNS